MTSGERRILCSTCAIVCAGGQALPSVVVVPRINFKNFMIKDPGTLGLDTESRPVSIYEVGTFIGEAYLKAMIPKSITNSLRKTGIFLFGSLVSTDTDFLPSTVTNRPEIQEIDRSKTQEIDGSRDVEVDYSQLDQNNNCQENIDSQGNLTANENLIGPALFRHPLIAQPRKNIRKSIKKRKSIIATDTPEKERD
ncbi:hypothetical protein HHI36_019720 [Cryptolaemus montrouzieri]|uniref:Uncharacterized protein n=1 Tax=Cryptolaemus montrouzieri TaxID=559131 RepID=A0ABD2N899_9CUCU